MTKKNSERKNHQSKTERWLRRQLRISGKALLQGICRSLGYHLGTVVILWWWFSPIS
jgi:hypothetical protein